MSDRFGREDVPTGEMGGIPFLGKLKIDLGEAGEEVLDLDNIVPIAGDLSEEFSRQPSLYAYIAMMAANAEALYGAAKAGTERTKARTDRDIRKRAKAIDEKVTENVVFNRVLMDDDVEEAEETEMAYRYQYLVLKALTNAMDQRAQMLISLGAHLRAEAEQTGMLVRETKSKLDELKRQHQ